MRVDAPRRDPAAAKRAQNAAMAASAEAHLPAAWRGRDDVRIPVVCECADPYCWRIGTAGLAAVLAGGDRPRILDEHCAARPLGVL
jgi:hypothetical protein